MRKERRCGSNWGPLLLLFEKKTENVLSNVTYSPSHRQTGAPVINTKSKLLTAPCLCSQCYLVATVIHIQSLRSLICVCIRMSFKIYRCWLGQRQKNESRERRVPSKSFRVSVWAHVPYVGKPWSRIRIVRVMPLFPLTPSRCE